MQVVDYLILTTQCAPAFFEVDDLNQNGQALFGCHLSQNNSDSTVGLFLISVNPLSGALTLITKNTLPATSNQIATVGADPTNSNHNQQFVTYLVMNNENVYQLWYIIIEESKIIVSVGDNVPYLRYYGGILFETYNLAVAYGPYNSEEFAIEEIILSSGTVKQTFNLTSTAMASILYTGLGDSTNGVQVWTESGSDGSQKINVQSINLFTHQSVGPQYTVPWNDISFEEVVLWKSSLFLYFYSSEGEGLGTLQISSNNPNNWNSFSYTTCVGSIGANDKFLLLGTTNYSPPSLNTFNVTRFPYD